MVIRESLTMIIIERGRAASLGTSPVYFSRYFRSVDMYSESGKLWELVNEMLNNED